MENIINTPAIKELKLQTTINPLVYLVTHDEISSIKEIFGSLCFTKDLKQVKDLYIWSSTSGLVKYDIDGKFFINAAQAKDEYEGTQNINTLLSCIKAINIDKPSYFILRDVHHSLTPSVARIFKDMFRYLHSNGHYKTIICMSNMLAYNHGQIKFGIEPSLEKIMPVIHWDLPSREQISQNLKNHIEIVNTQRKIKELKSVEYTDQDFFSFSRALQGLTFTEIEIAVPLCQLELGRLDSVRLKQTKKQVILKSDLLEYLESNDSLDQLGGLDNLKQYIIDHTDSFSEEAIEFGVDPLTGILLVGLPGGGKSAVAKAIGNKWGLPTVRLDIGRVMGSLVGESEKRMRDVISQAKAIAPCILFVDEIEKGLSGVHSSMNSDGGTLSRVFGTLLTAMQEELNHVGVIMIATANNISILPPELIRRFSETFYVGMPTKKEREDIWIIHLNKKKRDPKKFDLSKLSIASKNFTGAEIEKSLKEAISVCFNKNKKELTTEDIIDAIKMTKPLYTVMHDQIMITQKWAKDRARFASSDGEKELMNIVTDSGNVLSTDNLDEPQVIYSSKS